MANTSDADIQFDNTTKPITFSSGIANNDSKCRDQVSLMSKSMSLSKRIFTVQLPPLPSQGADLEFNTLYEYFTFIHSTENKQHI